MYELPPLLKGTEKQQIAALRDYLVRMARSLEQLQADLPAAGEAAPAASAASGSPASPEGAARLRSLITKTAHTVSALEDDQEALRQTLRSDYLALSDFGVYQEAAQLQMTATARGVVESYDYEARLNAENARLDQAQSAIAGIRGQIRRGLIRDPDTGEEALGILIGEELHFSGAVQERNGLQYYELSPGQTVGVYTSTGWQFWIGGHKVGWFASGDSRLHTREIQTESRIQLGGDWLISPSGGFGVKRI